MSQRHELRDAESLKGLVDAAIEIAAARRDILQRMRNALEAGDNVEALKLAASLCGVNPDDQACN